MDSSQEKYKKIEKGSAMVDTISDRGECGSVTTVGAGKRNENILITWSPVPAIVHCSFAERDNTAELSLFIHEKMRQ